MAAASSLTPAFSSLADRAETIHHRDLERAVMDLYVYETEGGPCSQDDLFALIDDHRHDLGQIAAVYRAQVRDETLAYKAYLLAVCRRRKLFRALIALAATKDR